MGAELHLLLGLPLLALFIALPAAAAWRRRTGSREASDIASQLEAWAAQLQGEVPAPLSASLRARLVKLRLEDAVLLQAAEELARGTAPVLADSAQRLASRLRRRVAFERKMLARTASGLRRGALVACIPPLSALALHAAGLAVPARALWTLLLLELAGCLLLWKLARVEI